MCWHKRKHLSTLLLRSIQTTLNSGRSYASNGWQPYKWNQLALIAFMRDDKDGCVIAMPVVNKVCKSLSEARFNSQFFRHSNKYIPPSFPSGEAFSQAKASASFHVSLFLSKELAHQKYHL